jgi:predicted RND superfamily exporter protein
MDKRARISAWLDRFSEIVISRPKLFIFLSILLVAITLPFLPTLESDYGARIWFRTTDPMIKELDALEQKFGNDEMIIIAMSSPETVFTQKGFQTIFEITEKMWKLPEVVRVDSLSNFNYARAEGDDLITEAFIKNQNYSEDEINLKKEIALKDKIISGQFISKDGKISVIFGQLKPNLTGSPDYRKIVEESNKMMKPYEQDGAFKFHYIGATNINDAYREVSENDIKKMLPVDMLIMIIFLFFIFRTIEGVLIPLALVNVTIGMTLGTSALLRLKFDNLSAAIPGILIAICMADTIHILATYYRQMNLGLSKKESLRHTLKKNLVPTFLTSFTTMIGFISLTNTELIPVRNLGLLAAMGTMYAWLLTIFLALPLLLYIPYRRFTLKEGVTFSEEKCRRYIEFLDRNKRLVLWSFGASAVLAAWVGMQNVVNSDPILHFSDQLKIKQDSDFMLEEFNGLGGPQIMVDSGAEDGIKDPAFLLKVEELIHQISAFEKVNKVTSILDTIKHLNKKLHADDESFYKLPESREEIAEILLLYSMGLPQGMDMNNQMSLDNRYLKLGIMWKILDAKASLAKLDEIQKIAERLGLKISITGKLVLYHRMISYIVKTFFSSISLALTLIALVMIVVMGSWRLGLISLLPNIVPLAFGAAVMTIANYPIDIGTSLVLAVCLGIAVDDTIHFLAHYKVLIQTNSNVKDVLTQVMVQTSPALIFTTVVLTLCFGVFLLADFVPNINFGLLCSVILTIALATDLIYLPALLLRFQVKK